MVTKYPRAFVDGRWIDARFSQHPNYTKDRDTVSMRKVKVYPPSPKGIGGYNWQQITEWIPSQIEQGNPIGRKQLCQRFGVKEITVANRRWLQMIYIEYKGMFVWDDDPNYRGKRGRRIQWLKPVKR